MLDACYYINLDSSVDRNAAFQRRWRSVVDWPFPEPIRVSGIVAKPPPQWKTGAGSWGCFLSHFSVYFHALTRGHTSIVVFEDDVIFSPTFGADAKKFMVDVPDDWEQVHFGGIHDCYPWRVNDTILRCSQCCGLYAYALRGRAIATPFSTLARFPQVVADDNCHSDTLWSSLHKWRRVNAYAPRYWMAGHAGGQSDREIANHPADAYFQLNETALSRLTDDPGTLTDVVKIAKNETCYQRERIAC